MATKLIAKRCFYLAYTFVLLGGVLCARAAQASSAPDWMRTQINAPIPEHDEKTDAVLLYSETILTVQANGSIKRLNRTAFKILRPSGASRGTLNITFDEQSRVTSLRAWCIPASGKDYELKEKDAIESAMVGTAGDMLMSDIRSKLMRIPASTPGSIIGYEVEQDQRLYMKADEWDIQETVPVREARYTLQLPAGWSYKATWLNHADQASVATGTNQWQWVVRDVKPVRIEDKMPPWRGIAARLFIALVPPNGQDAGMQSWSDIGTWYSNLVRDRRVASPEIKQQVAELTAAAPTLLAKMQALANFAQNNIRYVAIEMGIGGYQPHLAAYVFKNRFGDCKDKATLLGVMLKEIGVESYPVIINTERGSVSATTPPNLGFNHAILAIALPVALEDAQLLARSTHPKLGKILFFDPTDSLTPFGRISGPLQSNFGLLVTPDGGELVELPKLPATFSAINRTAQMTLDDKGTLRGEIHEAWVGDYASTQRYALRSVTQEAERIKAVESVLARSFTSFVIEKATLANLPVADQPLEWSYSIEANNYAKVAGNLLLVRPRVVGSKSIGFLETKEPRENSIEFDKPERHKDVFEITLPNGYEVDELPPTLNIDHGFISYQSKTEIVGRKIRYTRIFEIKELSVPVSQADKLKQFYRSIAGDERNIAILKQVSR